MAEFRSMYVDDIFIIWDSSRKNMVKYGRLATFSIEKHSLHGEQSSNG